MFHLIPHIKSAYQIRSYVRMDIKRGNFMYLNLNIGIYPPGGGLLDISLGGEVQLGPSYPDPV